MITRLSRLDTAPEPTGIGGPDHPMRRVTREVAFDASWSPERAAKVAALFDQLAPEWHEHVTPERLQPLRDALARGNAFGPSARVLEVGSGTGVATPILRRSAALVVAADIAGEMLARAPGVSPRLQADCACLPVRDDAVDSVVHVNALLFPAEVDRVLAPGGSVVWVSTSGDRTPIYLSAADVSSALPGDWTGVASEAGNGSWAVLRRVT